MNSSRRSFLGLAAFGAVLPALGLRLPSAQASPRVLRVFKSPTCGCCGAWADHMRRAGFAVRVTETEDLGPIKASYGVAPELQSCHTALIGGYVIEGHVPAREVAQLLRERPSASGLAVPGMPLGSPGMEQGGRREPYEVILFSPSDRSVYARY